MDLDLLDRADQTRLQELRLAESFVDDTLRQVDRILASSKFGRVQRKARDFLVFVVAKTLLGHADQIKEPTVAIHVFHESTDFNPLETSKVRVAGADLRERLAEYATTDGLHDPIEILIPAGTYVPHIRDRRTTVAVSLFDNWHPRGEQSHLCAIISDEINYQLNQADGVRATRVTPPAEPAGSTYGLRGSVEHRGDILRVNVSLANLTTGRSVSGHSFEQPRDNVFQLTRDAADYLLNSLRAEAADENKSPVGVAARKRRRS